MAHGPVLVGGPGVGDPWFSGWLHWFGSKLHRAKIKKKNKKHFKDEKRQSVRQKVKHKKMSIKKTIFALTHVFLVIFNGNSSCDISLFLLFCVGDLIKDTCSVSVDHLYCYDTLNIWSSFNVLTYRGVARLPLIEKAAADWRFGDGVASLFFKTTWELLSSGRGDKTFFPLLNWHWSAQRYLGQVSLGCQDSQQRTTVEIITKSLSLLKWWGDIRIF